MPLTPMGSQAIEVRSIWKSILSGREYRVQKVRNNGGTQMVYLVGKETDMEVTADFIRLRFELIS